LTLDTFPAEITGTAAGAAVPPGATGGVDDDDDPGDHDDPEEPDDPEDPDDEDDPDDWPQGVDGAVGVVPVPPPCWRCRCGLLEVVTGVLVVPAGVDVVGPCVIGPW
jgi:hypothetical protein